MVCEAEPGPPLVPLSVVLPSGLAKRYTAAMGAGIFNLVVGLVMIVGGASGKLTLLGTNSSVALIAVGVGIGGLGVFQLIKSRKR